MLAFSLVALARARIRDQALLLVCFRVHDKTVDVVLAATLEMLEGFVEPRLEFRSFAGVDGRRRPILRRARRGLWSVARVSVQKMREPSQLELTPARSGSRAFGLL